MLLTTT